MNDVAGSILAALTDRRPVSIPVALVAAHPDDETIGAGASLRLFGHLLLVHATDGAPSNGVDARAAGFATAAEYAEARGVELRAALFLAGADPELVGLGFTDQAASTNMKAGTRALAALLARHGAACVITHPYEGGHPDHDATACMVHAACAMLPSPPCIVEMTSYHATVDGMAYGVFLPNGEPHVTVSLSMTERAAKRAMLDAFTTQYATLTPFGAAEERFRRAPRYDFAQPPHPGTLHYERFDWGMTGSRWRELAVAG